MVWKVRTSMGNLHCGKDSVGNARLLSLVEEGTRNVAGTISEEQHCVCNNFLRVSCSIISKIPQPGRI